MNADETPLERFASPRALEHWRWTEARRARFRDKGCTCELCEVMARLAAASDEPEAPGDVIERARASVERSMGRAWTDEGEYANLPQQAAHDLATAGLLRTGVDDRATHIAHEVGERIAQAIEVEMRRHDHAQVGFSAVGDAYAHAARIAREVGEAGR